MTYRPGWRTWTRRRPLSPARTCTPASVASAVAVRRKVITGVHHRSSSSTAVASNGGWARSRCWPSGCANNATMAPGRPLRSVSLPATAKSQNRFSELLGRHPAAGEVDLGQQDRHDVVPARGAALALSQQVRVGVEVGHPRPGARVGQSAVRSRPGSQPQRLAGHCAAARSVEGGRALARRGGAPSRRSGPPAGRPPAA